VIGKTLAHYEVIEFIGKGGMGEVYRARDRKLQRDVAIKILPGEMSQDPERLARFDREARALAALQHPNVASAYGLEKTPEARFLVMELVEGKGLNERMAQGPIGVSEVRHLASQIASGLGAAHDKGLVHRDLKPANIRISTDGTVKILDFGLAKAWSNNVEEDDLSNSPTRTSHGTVEGVILGTAGYMSPEQARGEFVNKQTDIWAFGVIVWEMLTGKPLFHGTTTSDIMAAVLRAEIDFTLLPDNTPVAIRRLVRRCLERDPKRRLRDIGDAALELAEIGVDEPIDGIADNERRFAAGSFSRPVWLTLLAIAALGSSVTTWFFVRRAANRLATTRVAEFTPMSFGEQTIFNARFLPGNEGIVYSSAPFGNVPYLEYLPSAAVAPRRIGPAGAALLAVSGEGELAVLTDSKYQSHRVFMGTLARMTIDGSPRPLMKNVHDADWGPNGKLAIVQRVAGVDRLEYPIGNVLFETSGYISDPRVSPDGKQVAFNDHEWWNDDRGRLRVVDENRQVEELTEEYWAIEGVVWARDMSTILFAASPDASSLRPMAVRVRDGRARPFLGVSTSTTIVDADAQNRLLVLSGSEDHGVAVHPKGSTEDIDLTWLDSCWSAMLADEETLVFTDGRGGSNYSVAMRKTDGTPVITLGPGDLKSISPNGAWVAAQIATPPGIALYPTGAGAARHLDPGPIVQFQKAFWFPDSDHLLVVGNEAGGPTRCYRQALSGGAPEPVTVAGAAPFSLLTLDGKAVLAQNSDLTWFLCPLDGGAPRPVPGLHRDDEVWAWNPAGTAIYVSEQRQVPLTLFKVDLGTQERRPDATIGPAREPGLTGLTIEGSAFDPTGSYAYSYVKQLSQLFVVQGARW